ncbi:MAG: hypothetical protein JRE57_02905 [Deltaproteobacteria bacterium]|nr:hypothetical protein [Deltaproteobacteria bacterium]
MNSDEQMTATANDLRSTISDLLEVPHSDRIILAPGILVALRVLFSHLHIERIALTTEEYYGVEHFPGATVRTASCDALFDPLLTVDFEAVLASPASWRGTRQPVEELFTSIRKQLGRRAPLLVADYAHAGSVGFPSVERLGADVVCGDLEKWILPPDWNTRVAFLWFRTERLFLKAVEAFRPFFLATKDSDAFMLARWVDPSDVQSVSKGLASLGVTPDRLRERHRADMRMARELASSVEPARVPQTSVLWFEENELDGETVEELEKFGLVWRIPGRGTRVLCRSDVAAGARAHKKAWPLP